MSAADQKLIDNASPVAVSGHPAWTESAWFKEWLRIAEEGRQFKEPRPQFPDSPNE